MPKYQVRVPLLLTGYMYSILAQICLVLITVYSTCIYLRKSQTSFSNNGKGLLAEKNVMHPK